MIMSEYEKRRLQGLDILRGVCALGVATYHICQWAGLSMSSPVLALLTIFGLYGVSCFFVLSGYSLAHSYLNIFKDQINVNDYMKYIRRRFARIAPLYICVMLIGVVGKAIYGGISINVLYEFVSSVTLLFGFIDAAKTPVIGGWSIGVEFVFYLIFPLLMILRSRVLAIVTVSLILAFVAESQIQEYPSLPEAWSVYVKPANHWLFFCSGVLGRLVISCEKIKFEIGILLLFVMVFIMWICALDKTEIQIVTGWLRYLFAALTILTVIVLANMGEFDSNNVAVSEVVGGMSYSLYLIHPLVYYAVDRVIKINASSYWFLIWIISVVSAYFIYRYIDLFVQDTLKKNSW
jgi:peptidoglycan/LPS O-acetylase OafA/YrhL